MNILLYTICFLFFQLALWAKPDTRTVPSNTEVYIFGFIMFFSALGTLLLVIYILSRIQEKRNPAPVDSYDTDTQASTTTDTGPKQNKKAFIEKVKNAVHSEEKKQSLRQPENEVENIDFTSDSSVQTESSNFNPEVENLCRDLLYKLSGVIPCKSIAIFLLESQKFTGFLEKTGSFIIKPEDDNREEITSDMKELLDKKQGAYSVDHREAVLPLFGKDGLYGAIKFKFEDPIEQLDVSSIWGDIKSYSSSIYAALQEQTGPNTSAEVSLYNLEQFYEDLAVKFKENLAQNLTLLKVVQTEDLSKTLDTFRVSLPEIISTPKQVYRVSIDTVAVFFSIEERETFSHSLKQLLQALKAQFNTVEICVGSADYHSNMKVAQKWYERALNTLNEAVAVGPNNYRLYKVE